MAAPLAPPHACGTGAHGRPAYPGESRQRGRPATIAATEVAQGLDRDVDPHLLRQRDPDIGGRLRGQSVEAERRQQAEDAGRHAARRLERARVSSWGRVRPLRRRHAQGARRAPCRQSSLTREAFETRFAGFRWTPSSFNPHQKKLIGEWLEKDIRITGNPMPGQQGCQLGVAAAFIGIQNRTKNQSDCATWVRHGSVSGEELTDRQRLQA